MAAPKGNKFWELRSKHGRDKIFESPDILLEAACEYFEIQEGKVWERTDYKGKEVIEVHIPTSAPFTLSGLCIFLGVNTKYFNHFESSLEGKEDKLSKDFSNVITHIREIIYTQKFEGAAVGAYNANIIARDLGLADKKETEHSGSININPAEWVE